MFSSISGSIFYSSIITDVTTVFRMSSFQSLLCSDLTQILAIHLTGAILLNNGVLRNLALDFASSITETPGVNAEYANHIKIAEVRIFFFFELVSRS